MIAKAKQQEEDIVQSKKHGESSAASRKQAYSREGLLPEELLGKIPYKETYTALENEDNDALAKLLGGFVRVSMIRAYERFEFVEQKRDKKNIMKGHVYLDALMVLHRLPNSIQKPLEILSEQNFKGLNSDALRAILERFTEIQEVLKGETRNPKGHKNSADETLKLTDFKFVKTKELQKVLMCHIIGIAVHLAKNNRLKGSVLAKTLKKNIGELKNFIKEVGLNVEAHKNEKTNEPDIMIFLNQPWKRKNDDQMKNDI